MYFSLVMVLGLLPFFSRLLQSLGFSKSEVSGSFCHNILDLSDGAEISRVDELSTSAGVVSVLGVIFSGEIFGVISI